MEAGEMFIPGVLMAAQVMGAWVEILKPFLGEEGDSGRGCVPQRCIKFYK